MRVGEELLPMNEELMRSILLEQEGDFSAKPCEGLSIYDLDKDALEAMKRHYSQKQGNDTFLTQTNEQVLVDLELMKAGKLTHAALILLAKKEKLQELLPQSEIRLEYCDNPASIASDNRHTFLLPYFQLIDELWKVINARNKSKKVQVDSFIIDIHDLNNEVVCESINNAIVHRDYTKTSEIVIKQSPDIFSVSSHGGLPLGVTKQNILTVNSTPRNRLLAEVMTKTGLVERSGQGVDKIFYQTLSEGKALPSYDDTNLYRVVVNIPVVVKRPVFALFIRNIQQPLSKEEKFGVHYLITLVKIREHQKLLESEKELMPKLIKVGAVRESDNTILLEQEYTPLVELQEGSDRDKVIAYVKENAPVKMGDILELFSHRLTRRQVNNMVYNLVEGKVLGSGGKGKGTTYGMK